MGSKFKIVGDSPETTKDVKNVIKYLENVVINKDTLQTMNTTELVENINKLLQCVEVFQEYKKPILKLIKDYQDTSEILRTTNLSSNARRKIKCRKEVLEELLTSAKLNEIQITRKDYWEDYE